MNKTEAKSLRLRHVSFYVQNITSSLHFYEYLLGMRVYFKPDERNVYLTTGSDVVALHETFEQEATTPRDNHSFDHIGFFVEANELSDLLARLRVSGVKTGTIQTHRDGCQGFYALDPDGNSVEFTTPPTGLL